MDAIFSQVPTAVDLTALLTGFAPHDLTWETW
jgi:hypothetical protein